MSDGGVLVLPSPAVSAEVEEEEEEEEAGSQESIMRRLRARVIAVRFRRASGGRVDIAGVGVGCGVDYGCFARKGWVWFCVRVCGSVSREGRSRE